MAAAHLTSPTPVPAAPPSESQLPAPPSSLPLTSSGGSGSHITTSRTSISTVQSTQSRKEYLNSLVPPSKEEFAHIADVQNEREALSKRRSRELHVERRSLDKARRASNSHSDSSRPPTRHETLASKLGLHHVGSGRHSLDDEGLRAKAAILIQRTYRGYRVRRQIKGLGIDSSTRWIHAIREAQWREINRPRARTELLAEASALSDGGDSIAAGANENGAPTRSSTARQKWRKAALIAHHATADADDSDSSSSSSSSSSSDSDSMTAQQRKEARLRKEEAKAKRKKDSKAMGLQYFLEMVDLKHRYGSNLRTYHEEWQKADTNENFFYWLDYGEGRYVDIEACPRERLDREQVRYLSREERQYYLVKVDKEGRLCWAKNGARIDTSETWKDSIHGIVPADDPTPAYQPISTGETRLLGDSSSGTSDDDEDHISESELEAARAAKYANPGLDQAKGVKKIHHVSATTIFNKLLRKSVRKNTWIFVADTSFRLYVGIKNSGAFQHSSFLQGSRISAAGLIKIKKGRLSSLSPLSGHYRPPASNFRAFVKSLKEEGVDMHHVSISKSYAVLVGLEAYMKTRQKTKDMIKKIGHHKDKIVAPEVARQREEDAKDTSESAAREREFLEQEERERDQNKATVQLLQKLHISPREPDGQKGEDAGDGEAAPGIATNI